MAEFLDVNNKNLSILDASNKNNHAGVERREASERAEALLKLINEYRVYSHRFESLPTWDVLEFLSKLEKELFNRFGEDVENGEIDKLRNEYFMVVGKKPFMAWNADELRKRIEDYKSEMQEKNKLDGHYLSTVKKNQWKKLKK
ncbi:MAG: hypothetical protein IIT65_03710 [Lachnospiraceae bacterium]|nr:hypothetical protein [Lachnospiraceae bacterium]